MLEKDYLFQIFLNYNKCTSNWGTSRKYEELYDLLVSLGWFYWLLTKGITDIGKDNLR